MLLFSFQEQAYLILRYETKSTQIFDYSTGKSIYEFDFSSRHFQDEQASQSDSMQLLVGVQSDRKR